MRLDRTSWLVVIGNSGTGKSTLAMRLADHAGLVLHHLDPVRWSAPCVRREADEAMATAMARRIAASRGWIAKGVFGWLAEVALPAAERLVWLDLPSEECRAGILHRGPAQEGSIRGACRASRLGGRLPDPNDLVVVGWARRVLRRVSPMEAPCLRPRGTTYPFG